MHQRDVRGTIIKRTHYRNTSAGVKNRDAPSMSGVGFITSMNLCFDRATEANRVRRDRKLTCRKDQAMSSDNHEIGTPIRRDGFLPARSREETVSKWRRKPPRARQFLQPSTMRSSATSYFAIPIRECAMQSFSGEKRLEKKIIHASVIFLYARFLYAMLHN